MTAVPFGPDAAPDAARLPAPAATHTDHARAGLLPILHPDPTTRARMADDAWQILCDATATDDEVRRACHILRANCTDARRDTAIDLLAVMGDRP
jgi:hypothetical protein